MGTWPPPLAYRVEGRFAFLARGRCGVGSILLGRMSFEDAKDTDDG
jgi:hypothetical protein